MEDEDDPNHPAIVAAKLRIAELDSERMRLLEQITDATEKAESRPEPTPALDVGVILADLPYLRPVLATYTDTELADLFDAFDLNIRVHKTNGEVEVPLALSEGHADRLEIERPPGGGRTKWG